MAHSSLYFERPFLRSFFAPLNDLGSPWGHEYDPMLVAEEADGIYRVALYARPDDPDNWELSVVVSPPVRARAVLRFGKREYCASFDPEGTATVNGVPATYLTDGIGPPLEVRIEPEDG